MLGENYIEKLVLGNDSDKDDEKALSLFINNNSLMFAISGTGFKTIYQIGQIELKNPGNQKQTLTERINFLLNNYRLSQRKFAKVYISVLTKEFTLIPDAYSTDIKTVLSFSSGLTEIKNPFVQTIKNVKFCYSLEHELIQYLEKTFPQAIIKHAGAVTANLFFSNYSLLNCNLFLVINDGLIELAAKDKNDLLFYNVFSYENNEDILYYLLFMMEQFNLNPLQVKLLISGEVQTNSPLILSIKKYIKHVNFVVHDSNLKLEGDLANLPLHYYFTLLNQHLCE